MFPTPTWSIKLPLPLLILQHNWGYFNLLGTIIFVNAIQTLIDSESRLAIQFLGNPHENTEIQRFDNNYYWKGYPLQTFL